MCERCKKQADGLVEAVEELCEEVEMVRGFGYLGDRVNASGGMKVKGMVYRSCVRVAMLLWE